MHIRLSLLGLVLAASLSILACGNDDTSPNDGDPPPGTAGSIDIGNTFFQSARNGTQNPAIDTVAAGTTVTWTWRNTGTTSHSVQSQGTPTFTSSVILAVSGSTHSFKFDTPGVYEYDCAVHGSAMTGRIVVP